MSNYLEDMQHPMVIASDMKVGGQIAFGVMIESNMIGTYSYDNPLITLGRVNNIRVNQNTLWRKTGGSSPAIRMTKNFECSEFGFTYNDVQNGTGVEFSRE